ncbi:MAG: hypothetical protein WAW11_04885 [Patescibacteria group bacterium]
MLAKFFFSWFLTWLPMVFSGAVLLVIFLNYFLPDRKYLVFLKKLTTAKLIYILIVSTLLFNFFLSGLQYLVWKQGTFSSFFLPPYQSITYFLRYSLFHFFVANILVLFFALAFYLILRLVKKYRASFISQEELSLILLSGLLVSWPNLVLFIPLFLLLAVIFSILKRKQLNLSLAIILSLLLIFILGDYLINLLSLSVLII